jgi:PAS domain S-box-containing protein
MDLEKDNPDISNIETTLESEVNVFRRTEERNVTFDLGDASLGTMQLWKALNETAIVAVTDRKGTIKFVNGRFCEISKYTAQELIGQDHRIINSGFHSKAFMKDLWVTISSGRIWRGEIRNKNKFGAYYWVDTTIIPFMDDGGGIFQYVAIRYDITRLKRTEEQLVVARDQAEAGNRTKSAFMAHMSHELRTPLNGIVGSAEYLKARVHEPKLNVFVGIIADASKTLLALINDILDLSKIEAGKMRLLETEVSLTRFIRELSNMFSVYRMNQNVEFIASISAELPQLIIIDELRLRQILYNLLGNAFKFTEAGKVTLNVLSAKKGHCIIFEIIDTGIGIAEGQQQFIFEPFHQQERQDSKYGGTGLGLSISSRLVQMMGGSIELKSEIGVGSEFKITLPYKVSSLARSC